MIVLSSSELIFKFNKSKGQKAKVYHEKLREYHAFMNFTYSPGRRKN